MSFEDTVSSPQHSKLGFYFNGRYFVMKELYTKPVVEVETFDVADVLTASTGTITGIDKTFGEYDE